MEKAIKIILIGVLCILPELFIIRSPYDQDILIGLISILLAPLLITLVIKSKLSFGTRAGEKHDKLRTNIPIMLMYLISVIIVGIVYYMLANNATNIAYLKWMQYFPLVLACLWGFEILFSKRRLGYTLAHYYGFCGVITTVSLYVAHLGRFDMNDANFESKTLILYPFVLLVASCFIWLTVSIIGKLKFRKNIE